jgi:hypothetical protein
MVTVIVEVAHIVAVIASMGPDLRRDDEGGARTGFFVAFALPGVVAHQ